MNRIRRHLTAIGVTWLVFQAGVLAVSPLIDCCATSAQTGAADDEECCKGMAPGQICPLHKHKHGHAPPKDTHADAAQSQCAIRGGCGPIDAALLSLGLGLGVLEPPVSFSVIRVSNPVRQFDARTVDCARTLDPPPPR